MIENIFQKNTTAYLFLIIISSFFFIGLGHVHLFDWDEINFAESAREMIESADYFKVQINYKPFWEKPPLFFWLQVLCMKLFGVNEYSSRLPNAVFGLIYLITIYRIGKQHYSFQFGMIWSLIFAASILPHLYFKSGIIDPVFNYFIFLSVYYFYKATTNDSINSKYLLLSGIFSSLSVLTKGPVGLLLLGLSVLVFLVISKFKKMPPVKNWLVFIFGFLILFSVWILIELSNNGIQNLEKFIAYQVELFTQPVAGHEQPFFYHFVIILIGCFPISILALPKIINFKHSENDNFLLWMKIIFWVVLILFSITKTKIVHYSSMTYLPLSFCAAHFLNQIRNNETNLKKYQIYFYLSVGIIWCILLLGVPIAVLFKEKWLHLVKDPFALDALKTQVRWGLFDLLPGIIFIVGFYFSYRYIKQKSIVNFLIVSFTNTSVTLLVFLLLVLPKIENYSQKAAIEFLIEKSKEKSYIETYGYKSYAQYFYGKADFENGKVKPSVEELINNEWNRNVYLIAKIQNNDLDTNINFRLLYSKSGFKFFVKK